MLEKKKSDREQAAQEFINVEAIENSILWTKDKHLFAFIRVRGHDNSLLEELEHEQLTDRLAIALSDIRHPWQLLSVPRTVDTQGMIQDLTELRQATDNEARLLLIDGEIRSLQELAAEGAKEPMIFFKLWRPAVRNADRDLMDEAATLIKILTENQISATLMDDQQILQLCTIYAELGIWQDSDTRSDIPYLKGRKRMFSRREDPEKQAQQELMEQITPVGGLFFNQPDSFMVGSTWCRCYGVTRYPSRLDYNWATKLMNATECITCITYSPGSSEMADALSQSIRSTNREARDEKDIRRKKFLERQSSDADRLISEMDAQDKALGLISIITMPYGQSKEEMLDNAAIVAKRYSAKQMKVKILTHSQKDAFYHLSPYYPNQPRIDDIVQRITLLETLVGGYPCTINTLRDDHGSYFARTLDRGMISVDFMYRGADRTNGNVIFNGIAGTGKSTSMKHLLESAYMKGMKIIAFDVERELRTLCKNLHGAWYDAGGGAAKVNLLQVMELPPDEEEEEQYRSDPNPLGQHIQYIQTILRFKIPSLTDLHISLLKRSLISLYKQFGMDFDTDFSGKQPTDYPIMADWHNLLLAEAAKDPRYEELATLLEDMAVGADAFLWNGHTNIDFNNDIVVIDTHSLQYSSKENQVAQYYNLLQMTWSYASRDRDLPFIIAADEAQTLFDPDLPTAAKLVKNIALRCRKYEVYLWLAFPLLRSLMDERIRIYGQPVVDSASYRILFGSDGQNLADTVSLFKLTKAEEKLLRMRERGRALAMIGSLHLKVHFDIPKYKMDLMGTGGGR